MQFPKNRKNSKKNLTRGEKNVRSYLHCKAFESKLRSGEVRLFAPSSFILFLLGSVMQEGRCMSDDAAIFLPEMNMKTIGNGMHSTARFLR